MAIQSNVLGSVTVTGEDAKAFTRKIARGRAPRAAVVAAQNGRKLVASLGRRGVVSLKLKPPVGEPGADKR
jgi:hypothetical protein